METKQLKNWRGKFGIDYTLRNSQALIEMEALFRQEFGISASEMFGKAVQGLPIKSGLEVGCNIGNKLALLKNLGLAELTGVEPLNFAISEGKKRYPFINFKQGTVFNLPFANGSFDLVFTSGVLIHINPGDLSRAMNEIARVAGKWILGFEYYSAKPERVIYRGKDELLWKRDFTSEYLKTVPRLKILYEKRFKHNPKVVGRNGLISQIFVLQKQF